MLYPIRAGSDVIFEVKISDLTSGSPEPFNPDGVTIQLRDSEDTLVLIEVLQSVFVGYWTIQYYIPSTAVPGPYTCSITAFSGDATYIIGKFVCFTVSRGFTITCGTYFAIKDQSNHIWYWWINRDHTIDWSDIPPPNIEPPDPDLVPSWLEISNTLPALRYVYPVLDGAPNVTFVQPLNGFGFIGSPAFTSLDRLQARVIVTTADETDVIIV
jgi:hypothetical protein